MNANDTDRLEAHVAELELQLKAAKLLLQRVKEEERKSHHENGIIPPSGASNQYKAPVSLPFNASIHHLMLLSDSALPLGSFAYSSGLESCLAHHKHLTTGPNNIPLFQKFLKLSIQSVAYTNVPYTLASFRDPLGLMDLDNDLDASTPCTVARRASIAQGRALLGVWEKAFARASKTQTQEENSIAITALGTFASDLKVASLSSDPIKVNGHFAPLWGVVCLCLGLNLEEAGYLFLLNHAKAVVSAAVRASVMGPYMAQSILASQDLQDLIRSCLEKIWFMQPEDMGQVVPIMDLWIGRHEMLYSRIFNS